MLFTKLNRFGQLSVPQKLSLLEAFICLILSKALVCLFPLKKIAPRLGEINGCSRILSEIEAAEAGQVRISIITAATNLPWETVCLDQAFACLMMLKRRRISCCFCLGIMRHEDWPKKIDAHAWVECGNQVLVGGVKSKQFKLVACFSNYFHSPK